MTQVPPYDELPANDALGMRHAWGVFGADDDAGTINLLTPDAIRAAATEIVRGAVFGLNLPLDRPLGGSRTPYRHTVFNLNRNTQDDVLDNFSLQGSTQWDALRHIAAREFGYYNAVTPEEAGPNGDRLGIDTWGARGIVGRGVLADVERHVSAQRGTPLDPFEGLWVTADLLDETLQAQDTTLQPGDILMLRTGYTQVVDQSNRPRSWPGLAPEEETARWLWDHGIAAIVADNPAVETAPGDPKSFLHRRLIPMLGMALGELFDLEALAEDCAQDGRYTSFFVAVPLNLPRGVGSPGNAIAIK